jgi:hypothetical protein
MPASLLAADFIVHGNWLCGQCPDAIRLRRILAGFQAKGNHQRMENARPMEILGCAAADFLAKNTRLNWWMGS